MKARLSLYLGVIIAIVSVLAVAVVLFLSHVDKTESPGVATKSSRPVFTVNKETTYVTGPVDKDGYIDYTAALNERLGKGITPETNANAMLWKALGPTPGTYERRPAKFFKLLGMDEPAAKGEYFVDLKKYIHDQFGIEDAELVKKIEEQLSETARYPWAAMNYPQIAEWLKANEKPLSLVVEASKRPNYFCPLVDGTILESTDPVLTIGRELTKALVSRALLKVNDGKHDQAWPDLLACHRLARITGRSAPVIWRFGGIVMDEIAGNADVAFLERAGLNSTQIQACVRDLHALQPTVSIADSVDVGERFGFLNEMMLVAKHGPRYVNILSNGNGNDLVDAPVENINWDSGLRIANQWYDNLVAVMREKDRPTRQKGLEQIRRELKELKARLLTLEDLGKAALDLDITPKDKGKVYGELLIGLLFPALQGLQEAADRAEQGERNLYVAFALAAHERDHKGFPKSLDALVPEYLTKLPNDLFTGKPLIYRPSETGYILYSLGPDGKDDEGRGQDDEPKGDDIAIRIPVPKPVKK